MRLLHFTSNKGNIVPAIICPNAPAKAKPKSEIRFIEVDSGIANPVDRLSKLPVEPVNKNIDKKLLK